jgi:hypothetical protein
MSGSSARPPAGEPRKSRIPLPAFLGDLLERPPVAMEGGFPAGQRLPAPDDYVHVLGVHRERMPSGNLTLDHVIP